MTEQRKIYTFLAGPDCFYPNAKEEIARKQELCKEYGLTPLPNEEFPSIIEEPVTDYSICWMNIKRLDRCELVFANLAAFRGAEPDAGTVWEAVYAYAKGKKVYGYYNYPDMVTAVAEEYGPVEWREEEGEDGKIVNTPFDQHGARIENWGKMVNLMLTGTFPCIHGSFEDCLEYAMKDLGIEKLKK